MNWKKENAFRKFKCKTSYKDKDSFRLWTEVSPIFLNLRGIFYSKNKKIITTKLLNRLKPLGLAVWFMDDGTLNLRSGGDISTDCFTKEENVLIQKYFLNKGIDCKIFKRNSGTYKIVFNKEGFNKLVDIIRPHIHKSMFYKIDEKRRKKYLSQFGRKSLKRADSLK